MLSERIFLMEDHHEALEVWRKLKIKDALLVHIDAHIDFGYYALMPAQESFQASRDLTELKKRLERLLLYEKYGKDLEGQASLANFIYPAMRDGIVKSFNWIVPGTHKEFRDSVPFFKRLLVGLSTQAPGQKAVTEFLFCAIRSKLLNKDFFITNLFSSLVKSDPVLLDIDVDFLLFNCAYAGVKNIYFECAPWIYPDQLVALLKEKFPSRTVTTIAYSVNGRYTPILYKFFGDEIALRLKYDALNSELEESFTLRNNAIKSYSRNDMDRSFRDIKEAQKLLEKENVLDSRFNGDENRAFRQKFIAHLYLWRHNICWEKNKVQEAKSYYKMALHNDPTLRVTDNNLGGIYLKEGKFKLARVEFERIIFCDPRDHNAHRGMGDIDFAREKYADAKKNYNHAVKIKSDDMEALVRLAECLLRLDDLKGAENILKKVKKIDPLNGRIYKMEAEIAAQRGGYKESLALYKKAAIIGPDSPDMYKNIFRILKIEKDEELLRFFRIRYEERIKKRKQKR